MTLIHAIQSRNEAAAIAALSDTSKDARDPYGVPAVVHAANAGMKDLLRAMVDRGADFSATATGTGWNALHAAVEKGQAALVPLLVVEAKIPVNALTAKGDSPLALADSDDDATKKALIQNGAQYVIEHRRIGDVASRWAELLDVRPPAKPLHP